MRRLFQSSPRLLIAVVVGLIAGPALKMALYIGYSAWMGVWDQATLRPLPQLVGSLLAVWLLLTGPSWSRVVVGLVACLGGLADVAWGVGVAWVLILATGDYAVQSNQFAAGVFLLSFVIALPQLAAGILLLVHPEVRRYLASRSEQRTIAQGSVSA